LHLAADAGHVGAVRTLLEHGAARQATKCGIPVQSQSRSVNRLIALHNRNRLLSRCEEARIALGTTGRPNGASPARRPPPSPPVQGRHAPSSTATHSAAASEISRRTADPLIDCFVVLGTDAAAGGQRGADGRATAGYEAEDCIPRWWDGAHSHRPAGPDDASTACEGCVESDLAQTGCAEAVRTMCGAHAKSLETLSALLRPYLPVWAEGSNNDDTIRHFWLTLPRSGTRAGSQPRAAAEWGRGAGSRGGGGAADARGAYVEYGQGGGPCDDAGVELRCCSCLSLRARSGPVERIRSLVLISRSSEYSLHRALLPRLASLVRARDDGDDCAAGRLESAVAIVLREARRPAPQSILRLRWRGADVEVARAPPRTLHLLDETCFRTLFRCLTVQSICDVLASLLLERNVLLLSSDLSQLAPVGDALLSLLFPLRWVELYVPFLPRSLLGMVESPLPFLMVRAGCQRSFCFMRLRKCSFLFFNAPSCTGP
jgi:hypothetical protein